MDKLKDTVCQGFEQFDIGGILEIQQRPGVQQSFGNVSVDDEIKLMTG